MAHLYSNENFPLPVVEELRRLEHNVLTIQETGKANQAVPDEAVLNFATEQGRAILTINRKHFVRLHKAYPLTQVLLCVVMIQTLLVKLGVSTRHSKQKRNFQVNLYVLIVRQSK